MSRVFDKWLEPMTFKTFLEEHFERSPFLVQASSPRRFQSLISSGQLDELLTGGRLRFPHVRLAKDGKVKSVTDYTGYGNLRRDGFDRLVSVDAVQGAYRDGYTVVLQSLQLYVPEVAKLIGDLQRALHLPMQANVYMTPKGSNGFALHHDTHDVFVLQVEGHKRWEIWNDPIRLPYVTERNGPDGASETGATRLMEVTLGPGHILYLPRGFLHRAFADDAHSIHLTLVANPFRRLDTLRQLVQRACGKVGEAGATPLAPNDLPLATANVKRLLRQTIESLDPTLWREVPRPVDEIPLVDAPFVP